MNRPVIDLHCDLLFYLAFDSKRTPNDVVARCALPQLQEGNVKIQTMAVFTETGPASVRQATQQLELYQKMPVLCPKECQHFAGDWILESPRVSTFMAFENASGFCDESEPLKQGFKRLASLASSSKPLYISLTWNSENRFGGGALTAVGLKEEGKRLLEEMHSHTIALDLSHASDALAYEAIDYMEGHGLTMPVIASHSNARSVEALPRNLPDEIAKEIFQRKGVIGFNLFRPFVGATPDHIVKHFGHWLELGGSDHIVFGADFFHDPDLPSAYRFGKEVFFSDYANSSCYPSLLSFLQRELKLTPSVIEKISHQNALNFLKRLDS